MCQDSRSGSTESLKYFQKLPTYVSFVNINMYFCLCIWGHMYRAWEYSQLQIRWHRILRIFPETTHAGLFCQYLSVSFLNIYRSLLSLSCSMCIVCRSTANCRSGGTESLKYFQKLPMYVSFVNIYRSLLSMYMGCMYRAVGYCLLQIGWHGMRGGGLGSRPKKMYGERLGDGVEYHSMKPTPRR